MTAFLIINTICAVITFLILQGDDHDTNFAGNLLYLIVVWFTWWLWPAQWACERFFKRGEHDEI